MKAADRRAAMLFTIGAVVASFGLILGGGYLLLVVVGIVIEIIAFMQ